MAVFSLCLHMAFPLCVCFVIIITTSSYKDTSHLELGTTWMILFKFISVRSQLQIHHILRYWGLGPEHRIWGAGWGAQLCLYQYVIERTQTALDSFNLALDHLFHVSLATLKDAKLSEYTNSPTPSCFCKCYSFCLECQEHGTHSQLLSLVNS